MSSSILECEVRYIIPPIYKRKLKSQCSKGSYRNYVKKNISSLLYLFDLIFSVIHFTPANPQPHWHFIELIALITGMPTWGSLNLLSPLSTHCPLPSLWLKYPRGLTPHHLPQIHSNVALTEHALVYSPQFPRSALFSSIAIFTFCDTSLAKNPLHLALLSKLSWIEVVVCVVVILCFFFSFQIGP